jgi:hypothetical protein
MEMLDEMNAQHAKDFAGCTRAETIEHTARAARPPPQRSEG